MTPAETATAAVEGVSDVALGFLVGALVCWALLWVASRVIASHRRARLAVLLSLELLDTYPRAGLDHACVLCELERAGGRS